MSFLSAFDFLNKGGWVAWVLTILSIFLWYALGYRFLFLKSSYLNKNPEKVLNEDIQATDVLGEALIGLKKQIKETRIDLETALQHELTQFNQVLIVHKSTVRAIVVVAPLLGLLGTVIGMIETFDSLQDSALYSQSGGIAGGISQALITTQLGLVVAIPGLLIGRKLDQRQTEIATFFERTMSFVQIERVENEV